MAVISMEALMADMLMEAAMVVVTVAATDFVLVSTDQNVLKREILLELWEPGIALIRSLDAGEQQLITLRKQFSVKLGAADEEDR